MTERQIALYRYLTLWADFTPTEARNAVNNPSIPTFHRAGAWRPESAERIDYQMEQDKNRRTA